MRHNHTQAFWKTIIVVSCITFLAAFQAAAAVQEERGSEQIVSGHTVYSWAKMAGDEVVEAGVTIPFALIENPPGEKGSGPAGAIALVNFPPKVQDTTVLNHFQLQWEKEGHEPPVFAVPHFDFHFYSVSAEEVAQISEPDPSPPPGELIPAGFVYPGAEHTVPQMGVHVFRPSDLEKDFTDALILGYYAGTMIFIEPMVTQETLLMQQPIAYEIPMPASIEGNTRYPTRFTIEYDTASGACILKFSDFATAAS
jgi:hypothetical protein